MGFYMKDNEIKITANEYKRLNSFISNYKDVLYLLVMEIVKSKKNESFYKMISIWSYSVLFNPLNFQYSFTPSRPF